MLLSVQNDVERYNVDEPINLDSKPKPNLYFGVNVTFVVPEGSLDSKS
jgi:hypothetical protein